MEESNSNNLSVSDKFGMFIPCSATYFLEVSALASLKVAINASFKGKKPQ